MVELMGGIGSLTGIVIAFVSLVVSLISLIYLRSIDKEQKRENAKCFFDLSIYNDTNKNRYLKITNIGKGIARNIKIECINPHFYFGTFDNQIPKELVPNQTISIMLNNHRLPMTNVEVKITWDEKNENGKSVEFSLQIPF